MHPHLCPWNHRAVLCGAWVGNRLTSGSFEIGWDAEGCNPHADRSDLLQTLEALCYSIPKGRSQFELLGLLLSRIIWCNKILAQPKTLCHPVGCHHHEHDWHPISHLAQVNASDHGGSGRMNSLWNNSTVPGSSSFPREPPEFSHPFIFSTADGSDKGFPLQRNLLQVGLMSVFGLFWKCVEYIGE